MRDAEGVAKGLGVVVQNVDARNLKEVEAAFPAMKQARADAIIVGVLLVPGIVLVGLALYFRFKDAPGSGSEG